MGIIAELPFREDLGPEAGQLYDAMEPLVRSKANEMLAAMEAGDVETARSEANMLRLLWEIQFRSGTISLPENIKRIWDPKFQDRRTIIVEDKMLSTKVIYKRHPSYDGFGYQWVAIYSSFRELKKNSR